MRKKQIIITILFMIIITCLALYFQWAEFYKGYSLSNFNYFISITFLLIWAIFSFYWGLIQEKKYKRFIMIYWGGNIIISIIIWIFASNKLIQSLLFPFYIWYVGPLYGFKHMLLNIDVQELILITSPLGMLSSFIGYWLGSWVSKFSESKISNT